MTMSDYYKAKAELRKKWYQLDMNFSKPRTKPETKDRMQREFDDAVLRLAEAIREGRQSDRLRG